MNDYGARFGSDRVDVLGFTQDDWIQEARIAAEVGRRSFRATQGYGRKVDEARYAAASARNACISLYRRSRRMPQHQDLTEVELLWDPFPVLEARDCLTRVGEEEPVLFSFVAERFVAGESCKVQLRTLRRRSCL
jgi:DNA-directed RNA polymerase specialized sigma24 family protein